MQGLVLHAIGDLRLEDVAKPTPKSGEVLVKIRASGVCGSDIPRIFEKGTYNFPTIPGHEFAGEIVELGVGVAPELLNKKVAVFPLLPCGKCDLCQIGEFAQCKDYNYFGSRCDGGFAEFIAVPLWNLVMVPDALSFEEAAMAEPAAVAVHALRQAEIEIGDTVVIFGAGPIGLMLASWAKAWGAYKTILVDIDKGKIKFAQKLGFENVINSMELDAIEEISRLTEGKGADVCVEGAGVSKTLEQCLFAARAFGRVVAMGNPAGEMKLSQKAYWELLRKQLKISGTWNSSYSPIPKNDWKLSIDAMTSGLLDVKPFITHRVALSQHKQVLEMMRDRSAFYNKVMFSI
ncbi:MAG: galactitol-1-phosphate 5-dehydrogenase [Bacillota bacterium]